MQYILKHSSPWSIRDKCLRKVEKGYIKNCHYALSPAVSQILSLNGNSLIKYAKVYFEFLVQSAEYSYNRTRYKVHT